ncbi:MAG: hypothetical protein RR942_05930 [Romboutsia sp.]
MKIELIINNEEKTFTAPFISARKLKETIKLSKKLQVVEKEGFDESIMDELVAYEVKLYGDAFTADELLDGYSGSEFFEKILSDINSVVGSFGTALKN